MRGILIKIPNCGIDEKITHQYAQIVPQFADINRQSKAIIAAWEKAIDEGEEITLVINPSKFQATIGGLLSNDFEKAMNSFLNEVAVETAYIQQKWPGNVNNLAALTEEVGELAKAMLERENVFHELKASTKFRTPKYIKNRTKIIENSLRAMPLPKGRDK